MILIKNKKNLIILISKLVYLEYWVLCIDNIRNNGEKTHFTPWRFLDCGNTQN